MKNPKGKVIGRVHRIMARPKVDYTFAELHAAFSDYLDAVVKMLGDLSQQPFSGVEPVLHRREQKLPIFVLSGARADP